jgi:hypothetical protein
MNEEIPESTESAGGTLRPPTEPPTARSNNRADPGNREALPFTNPVSSELAAAEPPKQDFLWHTHGYLSEYARFADTKAAFSGTISGALLGFLYTTKAFLPLFTLSYRQWPTAAWLAAVAGSSLCLSAGLSIWTIRPRLTTTQSKGYIYWGNVAAYREIEEFKTAFHSQSPQALNDCLLHHIFDLSKHVCVPKYRAVSVCMLLLFVGGLLAIATLAWQDRAAARNSRAEPAVSLQTSLGRQ